MKILQLSKTEPIRICTVSYTHLTIFSCGTFEAYEKKTGKKIHQMNPSHYDMKELLDVQEYLNKVR